MSNSYVVESGESIPNPTDTFSEPAWTRHADGPRNYGLALRSSLSSPWSVASPGLPCGVQLDPVCRYVPSGHANVYLRRTASGRSSDRSGAMNPSRRAHAECSPLTVHEPSKIPDCPRFVPTVMNQTSHFLKQVPKLALVLAAALFVVGVPADQSIDIPEPYPTPAIDTAIFAVG